LPTCRQSIGNAAVEIGAVMRQPKILQAHAADQGKLRGDLETVLERSAQIVEPAVASLTAPLRHLRKVAQGPFEMTIGNRR